MIKLHFSVIALVLIASCQAWVWPWQTAPEWDGLRAGFGVPLLAFKRLPRTETDAVSAGWIKDTTVGCDVSGTKFNGNRYTKDGNQAAMVLYDKNGFIAGLQSGIPKSRSNYPGPQNSKYHVFLEEPGMWVITSYFTEPADICTVGRTESQYETEGTGSMLAIQTGASPASLMRMPLEESDVLSTTNYVQGHCFWWMGMHYWYDVSKTMSCDDTFPVFLMYNRGKLNAFGFAFNPNYNSSSMWEHPSPSVFGSFIKDPPTCLGSEGAVTTLHVYLSDSPMSNRC